MAARFLIVGNGAAGLAAAESIRRRDPQGEVIILTEEPHAFYSRPGLAYFLTGAIPEKQLFSRPESDYRQLGITRIVARVESLDPAGHALRLHDGRSLPYDRLLLATGARAVRPDLPGIDLQGVVTLDNLDDARRIVALARRARRAVVVGGGITALELAEGLNARGVETHYLLRRDRYWGNVLEPDESALVEAQLAEAGIRLHRQADVTRLLGRSDRLAAVELASGSKIECQIFAVAIGIRPRLRLALQAGLATDRGILVDEHMRTSAADIFAAGDVAEVLDPQTGARHLDSLWWAALEAGSLAGENMAGGSVRQHRPPPFNVTSLGGLTTTILGCVGQAGVEDDLVSIARGDSEIWRQAADGMAVECTQKHNRLRLMLAENTIAGAVVLGDQTLSRPLQALIRQRVDITPIRPRLLAEPAGAPAVLLDFWKEWSAARAAQP